MNEDSRHLEAAEISALVPAESDLGTLELGLGGLRIRVRSNSPSLLAELERYYRTFRSECGPATDFVVDAVEHEPLALPLLFRQWPREPGKSGPKEEFADVEGGRVVRKVRTGMCFLIGRDHRLAIGPCEKNANQIINFVNTQLINHYLQEGWILGHAAAIADPGGGNAVVIAASSGGGKSTLALRVLSRGANFMSNDRVLLHREEDGVRVWGVPKLPRINPGTILNDPRLHSLLSSERRAELATLPREALWRLEEKYDVDLAACYPESRYVHGARLSALVVLDWNRGSEEPPRFLESGYEDARAAFGALQKGPGPFYVPRVGEFPNVPLEPEASRYLETLSGLPTLEVTGGVDFAAVADQVATRLALGNR